MTVQSPTRDDRGNARPDHRLHAPLDWLVVIDVLLVVCSAPAIVVWMLLAPEASNLPLYAAALVVVLPATTAPRCGPGARGRRTPIRSRCPDTCAVTG